MNDGIKRNHGESAPGWVVTFADMMILLLCFFVLLLTYSEMDRIKFGKIVESMEATFGARQTGILQGTDEKKTGKETTARKPREEIAKEIRTEILFHFQDVRDLIQVDVNKNDVTIRLMGETTFDSGEAVIRAKVVPFFRTMGKLLRDTEGNIIIAGHTDNIPVMGGPYRNNLRLSMARAASVAELLVGSSDIRPERISAMGFGEFRPLNSNATPEGRRKNRRVEIILSDLPVRLPKR